jgi:general L-amino acid transport system permease protein
MITATSKEERPLIWRDERVLKAAAQIISAVVILGILYWAVVNFLETTQQRGMSLDYRFLRQPAGFPIAESYIPYNPTMSFGRAFLVGLINTLVVSSVGIVLATLLGFVVAMARLSSNWLVSRIALAFIEFHRNIPLLVLLVIWYFGIFNKFPRVSESITLPGPIYINQRGLYLVWPRLTETGTTFLLFVVVGIILSIIAWIVLLRIRVETGKSTHYGAVSIGLLILLPVAGWFISGGSPLSIDIPVIRGFNFQGGLRLTPEFSSLLFGLTMYTAAFIAEVIRAGIQAVPRGQVEAAKAIGLRQGRVLRFVVIPQALRVIIPPLISQYLNLAKNSSLALYIGYQEVFAVGKVAINQAGRAIPVFILVMVTYLALSLITSVVLNFYNQRIQFIER